MNEQGQNEFDSEEPTAVIVHSEQDLEAAARWMGLGRERAEMRNRIANAMIGR